MQQFTRSLTREIEVGGERLAVTLSKEGLSVRPVGGRRPPHSMSSGGVAGRLCGAAGHEPTAEQIQEALKAVRSGAPKPADTPVSSSETTHAAAPAPAAAAATPPPASASSGHSFKDKLARLDHWLSAHRARFHHGLLPGASAADLDALAATLGKPLPEELRTWLSWHNGQNADVPGAFEQSFNLMSAQEIADAKKELDAQPHEGWQANWMPFLDSDNGDYLCLDLWRPAVPCANAARTCRSPHRFSFAVGLGSGLHRQPGTGRVHRGPRARHAHQVLSSEF